MTDFPQWALWFVGSLIAAQALALAILVKLHVDITREANELLEKEKMTLDETITVPENCDVCGEKTHWCVTKDCGFMTGHYGKIPALYCDTCRHANIMEFGRPLDEPREKELN